MNSSKPAFCPLLTREQYHQLRRRVAGRERAVIRPDALPNHHGVWRTKGAQKR